MGRRSNNRASRHFLRVSGALALWISLGAADPSIAQAQKSINHLQAASDLLTRVPAPVDEETAKRLADLREHYSTMVALYRGETPVGTTPPAEEAEEDGGPGDWTDRFSDVERALTKILGSGTPLGPPTGIPVAPAAASGVLEVDPRGVPAPETAAPKTQAPPAPVPGPSSPPAGGFPAADLFAIATAKAGPVGFPDLELEIRGLLEQFRVELELFYTHAVSEMSSRNQSSTSS
jgi:hypothetical protein